MGVRVGTRRSVGSAVQKSCAQLIALTPTDLIMMTKRSINRQFEVMGFKTGIAASVDLLALSSFRDQGLYSSR